MNLDLIKVVAKKKGLNLKDVCKDLGFTYSSLNHNINSGFMDISRLEKIAKFLEIPIKAFFEDEVTIDQIISNERAKLGLDKEKGNEKEYHIGIIVEKRMAEIGMTQSQLAQLLGTTRQNVSKLLKTKTVDFERLNKINEVLNPAGSTPFDIFSMFAREAEEPIEERYIKLLEKHMRYVENYNRILAKYNIKGEFID